MNEQEKLYSTLGGTGVSSLVLGVVMLVTGITTGVLMIITGARLLKRRSKILI